MPLLPDHDLLLLCKTAEQAAQASGKYIQSQVNASYTQGRKSVGSSLAAQVVTAVDLRAQEIILEHLATSIDTYELGLLTEEAEDNQSRLTQAYFWCIDPMDGTLAFTEQRPGYAVSIALISQAGDPVVGVAYIPDEEVLYSAVKGHGVQRNGQPFVRPEAQEATSLQVYDYRAIPQYAAARTGLETWASRNGVPQLEYRTGYGAVRNALAVMNAPLACYFKYPKPRQGGGNHWDYAATRIMFEELGLWVSNAQGQRLHLNHPKTTYMNIVGVLYATDEDLAKEVVRLGSE
ncbi:MAG TPA: inositol monophosphatase [Cytophagales bacterium]|nr:inositol monophosphatase [Cytophagales bacterium]